MPERLDPSPTDERIARLEGRVRRLQLTLGGAAVLIAAACTTAAVAGDPREVRAERFVVVDPQGREWGRFVADGKGALLAIDTPTDAAGGSPGASVLLSVYPGYERAAGSQKPGEAPASPWYSAICVEGDSDRGFGSGVNIGAHGDDGAGVSAWHDEKRTAAMGVDRDGARLELDETPRGEAELGALSLRLESASPSIEGRTRDGGVQFRIPQ